MRFLFVVLACATISGGTYAAAAKSFTLKGTIVSTVVRPHASSGVIAVYAVANIASSDGRVLTVFFPYFSSSQFLPSSGDKCELNLEISSVKGSLPFGSFYLEHVPLVRRIRCGSRSWSESGPR